MKLFIKKKNKNVIFSDTTLSILNTRSEHIGKMTNKKIKTHVFKYNGFKFVRGPIGNQTGKYT